MQTTPTLEVLAAFVHGAVAFGNALGVLYNLHRRNHKWAVIHTVGVGVHIKATLNHARELRS